MGPTASMQAIAWCIRVHPDGGDWRGGDAYDWSATVQRVDDQTCELLGVDKPVTRRYWHAIATALILAGFRYVIRRRASGSTHRIELAKYAGQEF